MRPRYVFLAGTLIMMAVALWGIVYDSPSVLNITAGFTVGVLGSYTMLAWKWER